MKPLTRRTLADEAAIREGTLAGPLPGYRSLCANSIGIINLNGGNFNGSGLPDLKLGRDGGTGQVNISAGSFTLGDSIPLFDVTNCHIPHATNNNSYFNFTLNSTGTLAINGANQAFYQNLWNTNYLRITSSF